MDIIFPFLGVLLGLGIPILIVAGIFYFILRIRAGIPIRFSYRAALRIYFYVMILIGIGLGGLGGVSILLKVGLGEIVGREFSYGRVYEEHRYNQEREKNEDYLFDTGNETRSLPEKVELEMKGSLINGVSLAVIGLFLLVVHFLGRWCVETGDERSDLLRRLYLMAGLVIFAIVTIISLAAGIPETLRYALLDVNPGEESPGEPLSIAIVALSVWICYLVATLRNIRTSSIEPTP
ncbi:MAG: DUF5671 domain-containing protein [Dehalococcoidales bacterium]|nr:DUF5671 domain-containing protein [Dehalococcoidales bacterium]